MRPYEVIEHTAGIGIRAHGRSAEELFRHLAQGTYCDLSVKQLADGSWAAQVIFDI